MKLSSQKLNDIQSKKIEIDENFLTIGNERVMELLINQYFLTFMTFLECEECKDTIKWEFERFFDGSKSYNDLILSLLNLRKCHNHNHDYLYNV